MTIVEKKIWGWIIIELLKTPLSTEQLISLLRERAQGDIDESQLLEAINHVELQQYLISLEEAQLIRYSNAVYYAEPKAYELGIVRFYIECIIEESSKGNYEISYYKLPEPRSADENSAITFHLTEPLNIRIVFYCAYKGVSKSPSKEMQQAVLQRNLAGVVNTLIQEDDDLMTLAGKNYPIKS